MPTEAANGKSLPRFDVRHRRRLAQRPKIAHSHPVMLCSVVTSQASTQILVPLHMANRNPTPLLVLVLSAVAAGCPSSSELPRDVPGLVTALKDDDAEVRLEAASSLIEIGPGAGDALTALLEVLKGDEDSRVRALAAYALCEIRPDAKEVVPALIEALKDKNLRVRSEASSALARLKAVPALIEALEIEDNQCRFHAAYALGEIGPYAREAVPGLIEALNDKEFADGGQGAAIGLGKIGPGAKQAIPDLIKSLNENYAPIRREATTALGKIGPQTDGVVPKLIECLEDEDSSVRKNAAVALGGIGPDADEVLPALIDALKHTDTEVRSTAAFSLGNIGPRANDAVPALLDALTTDEVDTVRHSAALALRKIAPDEVEAGTSELSRAVQEELNTPWKVRTN